MKLDTSSLHIEYGSDSLTNSKSSYIHVKEYTSSLECDGRPLLLNKD